MLKLPEISSKTISRPGYLSGEKRHLIADPLHQLFWEEFYSQFYSSINLLYPIQNFQDKINPYFGYYGYRWHPINFKPQYFHIGIDITEKIGCQIQCAFDGLLEYSGFANVNGNYVVVKHPGIQTLDGFTLHSYYMHCKSLNIEFNIFQKLLRQFVSSNLKASNKHIKAGQIIATVGDTGNKLGVVPHLHLQFEFLRGDERIVLDPLKLYNKPVKQNLTANLNSENEFGDFYDKYSNELSAWRKFWRKKT